MEIKKVGVAGCVRSKRGAGSVQARAQSGYRTVVRETEQADLACGRARVAAILSQDVSKPKLTSVQAAMLNHLHGTSAVVDPATVISPSDTSRTKNQAPSAGCSFGRTKEQRIYWVSTFPLACAKGRGVVRSTGGEDLTSRMYA